jgi:hypothetical protein
MWCEESVGENSRDRATSINLLWGFFIFEKSGLEFIYNIYKFTSGSIQSSI